MREEVTQEFSKKNSQPDAKQKKHNFLKKLLLMMFVVPIVLLGIIFSLAQSERGTSALFKVINKTSFGLLYVDWRSGSLAHGGTASAINIHVSNTHVDIMNVSGEWGWRYLPIKWQVSSLSADEVSVTTYPNSDSSEPVPNILMPFIIEADYLQIGELNLVSGTNVTSMSDLKGSISSDKRHHLINLTQLVKGASTIIGQLKVDGIRPYQIDSQIDIDSLINEDNYRLSLAIDGDFNYLNIGLKASGGNHKHALKGSGDLSIQLLDQYYIHQSNIDIVKLNPNVFWDSLPMADLDFKLTAKPQSNNNMKLARRPVNGTFSLVNHAAAPFSTFSIPLIEASAEFSLTSELQRMSNIKLLLSNNGSINGDGVWQNGNGMFKLNVLDFDLKNIHPNLLATRLSGILNIDATKGSQHFLSTLSNAGDHQLEFFADVKTDREKIDLVQGHIVAVGNAKIELKGHLFYSKALPFELKTKLSKFNLTDLGDFPSSQLSGDFDVNGSIQPKIKFVVKGALKDSLLADVPAKGSVDVSFSAPDNLVVRVLDVTVGDNHIDAKSTLGDAGSLVFNINAPHLDQLQFGFGGSLVAKGALTGGLMRPRGQLEASAMHLKFSEHSISSAKIDGVWKDGANGEMSALVDILDYKNDLIQLDSFHLDVKGSPKIHYFDSSMVGALLVRKAQTVKMINGSSQIFRPAVHFQFDSKIKGQGAFIDSGWSGKVTQLRNQGLPEVKLKQPIDIAWENKELKLSSVFADVQGAQLSIDKLNILGGRVVSKGNVSQLSLAPWLSWLSIDLPQNTSTDLIVKGAWDVEMGYVPKGHFIFEREQGDIWMDKRQKNGVGLSDLKLNGTVFDRFISINGLMQSERLGDVLLNGKIGLINSDAGLVISDLSSLDLNTKAELKQLQTINSLFGTNIKLKGEAQVDVQVNGAIFSPMMSGFVTGKNIDFLHVEQGFRMKNGVIRLKLNKSSVDFEQFDFEGVQGKLSVLGQASYGASGTLLTAKVNIDKFSPFVRLDRHLIVSGVAELSYDGINQLLLKGNIRADEASINLPPTLAPSLNDDIVVCSKDPKKSINCNAGVDSQVATQSTGLIPSIDLNLDLGQRFHFKGQGADVKLSGSVRLQSVQGSVLRANGILKVDRGSYRFYGQKLNVERGIVTFQSPIDDPALNIYASKIIGTIEVGVELTGTLAESKAALISNPERPDEEKLSWLLFGRSSSSLSTSDGGSIASAAAILLGTDAGRNLTEKLGLESVSLGSSDSGLDGTVVGVGKRLNDKFSIAYEQAVDSLSGIVQVTWRLSRHWQVILRGGTISGADVQYGRRFDSLKK